MNPIPFSLFLYHLGLPFLSFCELLVDLHSLHLYTVDSNFGNIPITYYSILGALAVRTCLYLFSWAPIRNLLLQQKHLSKLLSIIFEQTVHIFLPVIYVHLLAFFSNLHFPWHGEGIFSISPLT